MKKKFSAKWIVMKSIMRIKILTHTTKHCTTSNKQLTDSVDIFWIITTKVMANIHTNYYSTSLKLNLYLKTWNKTKKTQIFTKGLL
jgi:hypothetical protein